MINCVSFPPGFWTLVLLFPLSSLVPLWIYLFYQARPSYHFEITFLLPLNSLNIFSSFICIPVTYISSIVLSYYSDLSCVYYLLLTLDFKLPEVRTLWIPSPVAQPTANNLGNPLLLFSTHQIISYIFIPCCCLEMLLLHFFSSFVLTPGCRAHLFPLLTLSRWPCFPHCWENRKRKQQSKKNPMSSHLYNKQPGCVWTHTSCLPSHDRESTQGFFLRISPSPPHWLSPQELLKGIAAASLSSVPYIILFFVVVAALNVFQNFPI